MITIERITDLSGLSFTEKALAQTQGTIIFIPRYAKHMWLVEYDGVAMFVAGLYRSSLLEPPEFWLLLCEGAKGHVVACLSALKSLLAIVIRYNKWVKVRVEKSDKRARRLAEHSGFKPWLEDEQYYWYEVRS